VIIVAGTIRIRPEQREQAQRLARELMHASRDEVGCIDYTFSADLDDPDLYWLYEAWESEEVLAAHFETPHMIAFRGHLPDLLAQDPDIQRYRVEDGPPIDGNG
jgi:quinol monooxygenase YgiN